MKQAFSFQKSSVLILPAIIIIACWPVLYNGFPLLTYDSGAYILTSGNFELQIDRFFSYGIFVALSSFRVSLFGTVLVQSIMSCWLIYLFVKNVIAIPFRKSLVLLIVVLLSSFSTVAWYNSIIMPDLFTGILVVALAILLFGNSSRAEIVTLYIMVLFSVFIHNSNVLLVIIFSTLFILYGWKYRKRKVSQTGLTTLGIGIAVYLIVCTCYAFNGKGFTFSPSAHMFLISRMAASGVLEQLLKDNCADKNYRLCTSVGKIKKKEIQFLWNDIDFLHKAPPSGWLSAEVLQEYNSINRQILATPKYRDPFLKNCVAVSWKQMTQFNIGDEWDAFKEPGSSPYNNMNAYFPYSMDSFRSAKQQDQKIDFKLFNTLNLYFYLLLILVAFGCFIINHKHFRSINKKWQFILLYVLGFYIINATITASLSAVAERFSARIIWCICLCLLGLVMETIYQQHTKRSPEPPRKELKE